MVVGEALSSLVDKGDKRMDFHMEEMKTPEANWFKSLVEVSDQVGPLDPLKAGIVSIRRKETPLRTAVSLQSVARPIAPVAGSKIVAITEIEDDSNEEGSEVDGFTPYAKPDSDVEDSDEDATLITRDKPTAPVYVRDLITYLRDTEHYDRQKLGLQTAATLVRRKANFGTEVSSHAEELASLLVGLQDKFDLEGFQDMRLQGMIAILVASPLKMGQWFSKTFFDGDYSISQRATVLTTLGLGARELGGSAKEEANSSSGKALSTTTFPSKALPEKIHKIYCSTVSEVSAVEQLSTKLSTTMIAPMAAELADKMTGPSILKVRTFSSRMEVEKKRKKPIANQLAKVVADGFFFPLTGRFFIHMRAFGSSKNNLIFQPFLLTLFIKTLALLMHASGPSTLSLPQMTSEFWDLLLGLRTHAVGDIAIMDAMLFAFLTILEINEDKRRLVEAHGREMLETQEWVEGVFGRLGSGGSEEDERVRMLAAGCLIRIREMVEKYQALLLGDLASFQN
jgi:telomere length regulation protein